VFFCAPLFTIRSLIRLRTQDLVGMLTKSNRDSRRNPVDELSVQHRLSSPGISLSPKMWSPNPATAISVLMSSPLAPIRAKRFQNCLVVSVLI
jgi:hypothetical protein